jgi:hypothetical protein
MLTERASVCVQFPAVLGCLVLRESIALTSVLLASMWKSKIAKKAGTVVDMSCGHLYRAHSCWSLKYKHELHFIRESYWAR